VEAKGITVRAATAEDAAAIAQVHVDTWQVAYRGLLPDSVIASLSVEERRALWERVLAKPGAAKLDVAVDEAGIVGFCFYGPTRDAADTGGGEIYAIYVHPDRWRRGAGRALCEKALLEAAARGQGAMTLWVVRGNERACGFYERLGFARDGAARTNTKLLPIPFDEIRYRKALARAR